MESSMLLFNNYLRKLKISETFKAICNENMFFSGDLGMQIQVVVIGFLLTIEKSALREQRHKN